MFSARLPDHISVFVVLITDSACLMGFTCDNDSEDSSSSGSIDDASSSSSVIFKPAVGRARKICASMLKRPLSPEVPTPRLSVLA